MLWGARYLHLLPRQEQFPAYHPSCHIHSCLRQSLQRDFLARGFRSLRLAGMRGRIVHGYQFRTDMGEIGPAQLIAHARSRTFGVNVGGTAPLFDILNMDSPKVDAETCFA